MIGDLKPAAIRRVPRPPTVIDPDATTIVSGRYNSRSNSSSTPTTTGGGHPMEGYVLGRLSTRYASHVV